MAEGLHLLQLKKGLVEGTSYEATLFSPALLSTVEAQMHVGPTVSVDLLGRVAALTEVKTSMQTLSGAAKSINYVDKQLRSQKIVIPMMGINLEMIACEKAFALSEDDAVDFFENLVLQSPVELKDVGSKGSLTYYLVPKAGEKLEIPSDDNQSVRKGRGGRVIITISPASPPVGTSFPYKGSEPKAVEALKPTRYVQSKDKKIIALARQAIGESKDAAEVVRQIESFVAGYITEKDLSVGYASAVEVAASKQGDCSEHAVLTAAMCRAVGIPARIVSGLVYVEDFGGQKSVFGGHAWAQAYVGGKWIGLDASKGPNGFGPGHIALATGNGDPADFFGMLSTLGYFEIEKIIVKE
jgi:hypothetical protein